MTRVSKPIHRFFIKKLWFGALVLAAILLSFPKVYGSVLPVHEHGVANLLVVQQGGRVAVTLESPWNNLLGFEHIPRTAKEKQAVQLLLSELQKAELFFLFNKSAQCFLRHQKIFGGSLSGYSEGHHADNHHEGDHHDKHHHGNGHHEEGTVHRDVTAEYVFTCVMPLGLKQINFQPLLQRFTGIKKLNVKWVSDSHQFAKTLTNKNAMLDLVP